MGEPEPERETDPQRTPAARTPTGPGERRRLISRAIRNREAPPPGLEDVAMQVALRQSGLRWFVLLYAIGLVVQIVGIATADSTGVLARDALLALVFLVLGYVQWRTGSRAAEAVVRWNRASAPAPEERDG